MPCREGHAVGTARAVFRSELRFATEVVDHLSDPVVIGQDHHPTDALDPLHPSIHTLDQRLTRDLSQRLAGQSHRSVSGWNSHDNLPSLMLESRLVRQLDSRFGGHI